MRTRRASRASRTPVRTDSLGTPTREATLAAGRAFDRALGAAELAGDRYHRADWRAIAALACGFIEVEDPERSYDELARRAGAGGLDAEEQSWLRSPFVHPIVWANGSLELTNGQHRSCALCHSGAQRCPVVRH